MGLGNPAPFGLLSFGMTTAMLMYVDMGWVETDFEAMVAGYALFLGGLGQIIVAIFELIKGSSFSFAVFGCYGAFWLGWGFVLVESNRTDSNFVDFSYADGKTLWFIQWGVLSCCFFIITLRKNICLITVFALLSSTFFLLAAATGSGDDSVKKTGGYFGFATAVAAWYTGVAELVNEEYGRHILPGLTPIITPERLTITKEMILSLTSYDHKSQTLFLQFRGIQIKTEKDVEAIREGVTTAIQNTKAPSGKVHVVADYDHTLISNNIQQKYWDMATEVENKYYLSAKRFHVSSFGTVGMSGFVSTMLNVTDSRGKKEH